MALNRGEVVQAMADILTWDVPDDLVWAARARRFVDSAYKRVVADCPAALVPDEVRVKIPGVFVSGSGTAITSYISSTADTVVLEFTSSVNSSWSPQTDGSWDGLYWLEITMPDGTLYRCQCREFWTEVVLGVNHKYVSIDRPWTLPALVEAAYRLSPNYIWLRDDILRVVGGQQFGSTGGPLTAENISAAIWHDEWSNQNSRQYGYPRRLRAEKQYQHPSPNLAPVATVVAAEQGGGYVWFPEPGGLFDYCFTYIWGYRDPSQKSPSGNFIPLFESSPSPVSAQVTATYSNAAPPAGTNILVTLPNIAWELTFDRVPASITPILREGRSGWKKRVYRRRYTSVGGPLAGIEHPAVFQALVDVEDDVTTFTDDGSIIPDYTLRLPEVHGYRAWSPWPLPSGETFTEYQLLVQRAAEKLQNDSDAPRIVPACEDALTFYAVAYLARHDKDTPTAELYEQKAKEVIAKYRRDIANPTGVVDREAWDGTGEPRGGWPRARL